MQTHLPVLESVRSEVKARGVQAVARELGVARTTLASVLGGVCRPRHGAPGRLALGGAPGSPSREAAVIAVRPSRETFADELADYLMAFLGALEGDA